MYENLPARREIVTINKVYNQTLYNVDIKCELQPYVSADIAIRHMMLLDKRKKKTI